MFLGDLRSVESIFAYCISCNDPSHRAMQCKDFIEMPVVQRHGIVRKMGACRKCLKGKHFARDCQDKSGGCMTCDSPTHHTLLHYDNRQMMGRELGGPKGYSGNAFRPQRQSGRQALPSTIQMQTTAPRMKEWPSNQRKWANNGNGDGNGNGYMDKATNKMAETLVTPKVNNDVMFARLNELSDNMATIGQYISSQIKSTTLNTLNEPKAQEKLPGSSKINSHHDDNKTTNTYFQSFSDPAISSDSDSDLDWSPKFGLGLGLRLGLKKSC
jgi:hypothetical protein